MMASTVSIDSLDSLSSPYTDEMLSTLENKIVL